MLTVKEMVQKNFERGLWSKEMLVALVKKGVLTEFDYEKIVGSIVPSDVCTLKELKDTKLAEVDAWTAQKITGGFISECSGERVRYDSDKDTQLTMQGIALNVNTPLFEQEYPNGCPVRGYLAKNTNKTIFWLTAEQVLHWMADLSMHIGQCKQAGWEMQTKVNACTTKEELDKIVLGDVNA